MHPDNEKLIKEFLLILNKEYEAQKQSGVVRFSPEQSEKMRLPMNYMGGFHSLVRDSEDKLIPANYKSIDTMECADLIFKWGWLEAKQEEPLESSAVEPPADLNLCRCIGALRCAIIPARIALESLSGDFSYDKVGHAKKNLKSLLHILEIEEADISSELDQN